MRQELLNSAGVKAWREAEEQAFLREHRPRTMDCIRKLRVIVADHGLFLMTKGRNSRLIKVSDPQKVIDRMEAGLYGPASRTAHAIVHNLAHTWPRVVKHGYPPRLTLEQLAVFRDAEQTKTFLNLGDA